VDGTQGAGKVLSSDANGKASWTNGSGSSWCLTGNSGISAGSNFLGTTDNNPLVIKVNNQPAGKINPLSLNTSFGYYSMNSNTAGEYNSGYGRSALYSNTTGNYNTAVGMNALYYNTIGTGNSAHGAYALFNNTSGNQNTATGLQALFLNTTGLKNTATGVATLYENTTGSQNTATGHSALTYNTTGSFNTGGGYAMYSNTTGYLNTANGMNALYYNTTGYENTALGGYALFSNTTGYENTAVGTHALYSNTTGIYNTSTGWQSLYTNTTGGYNTASGYWALSYNTTGYRNTSTGFRSLTYNSSGNYNTANGSDALVFNTTGFQNTALGANSLVQNTFGAYNTAIGYNTGPNTGGLYNTTCVGIDAYATGNDMVRIGNIYVGSIGGFQNWTNISDERFKENVMEDVPGLSFITRLRPVTYRLNREKVSEFTGLTANQGKLRENDPSLTFYSGEPYSQVSTGFIAQEVEAAAQKIGFNFSGVDSPKNEGDFYGLRYAEFVVPLVKAVQEQQLIIENQQKQMDEMKSRMETLERIIREKQ
jgi:hypothetical protein